MISFMVLWEMLRNMPRFEDVRIENVKIYSRKI